MNRRRGVPVLNLLLTFTAVLSLGSCGPQANFTPIVDDCVCPGSTLRVNCTVVGAGITVWTVSVLPQRCQLNLQHTQFDNLITSGEPRFCGDMSIVAKPLSIVGNCYNSQLTIASVGTDLNGRSIVCEHDMGGSNPNNIGSYNITLTTDPFLPPNNVSLAVITNGLSFSWENVAPNCLSLSYGIDASGCGTCPTTTNSTSVTCSGIQLSGTAQTCNISVRAITCGNITGDYSEPLTTTLQAANVPDVTIIPVYSQNTSYLIAFQANIGEVTPVSISGNDVIVQAIQINYSTNGVPVCGSNFTQSCGNGMCSREINVMISSCTLDANSVVTVDVAATSVLGMGPAATLRIDGSIRNFVQVMPNIENTTITCEFPNQLDNGNKSCIVTYGQCGQQLSEMAQGSSTPEEPNSIQVELDLPGQAIMYCYIVTASNDTFTVFIEGNLTTAGDNGPGTPPGPDSGRVDVGAIVGSVIAILFIIIIIALVVAVVLAVIIVPRFKDRRSNKVVRFQNESGVQLEKDQETKTHDEAADIAVDEHKEKKIDDDSLAPGLGVPATSPLTNEEMKKLREKHPNQVPVAIKRYKGDETLQSLDKKYWIPEEWPVSKLGRRIRKDLGLSKDHPLYLTMDNKTVIEGTLTLKEIYNTGLYGGDSYLHFAYSSKDITDPNKS